MKGSFLTDWKCCVLRFFALGLTVATMVLTGAENTAYPFMFSVAAILFIGLSSRRSRKLGGKDKLVEKDLSYE